MTSTPAHRRPVFALVGLATAAVLAAGLAPATASPVAPAAPAASPAANPMDDRVGELDLLTDPFLQLPGERSVRVVWMTEYAGGRHVVLVGPGVAQLSRAELAAAAAGDVPGIDRFAATTTKLSQVGEDSGSQLADKPEPDDGIVDRDVWRHEARVTGLVPGEQVPYRVVSTDGAELGASGTFRLQPTPPAGAPQKILLTSDHQAMINTPANLEVAADTIGDISAVFFAGDLVNIPDRASEWFDDARGSAFFPVLQGRGGRVATNGRTYGGGAIIQNAPLFPAIGNHEVQGRRDGAAGLNASFNAPVPVEVAEREYAKVAATVNPTGDPAVKARWIEDNSFSTRTYEEIFSLPESGPGGERYYATTVGDVRLISLYSTRIWRGTAANPGPEDRRSTSRYQESVDVLDKPLEQGYGEHVFESLESGSEQLRWLEQELASEEFRDARFRVVMLHEGPQGLGDNVMPVFAHPERIETRDAEGRLTGVRYEYRTEDNMLVRDLQPLLEDAGVDLVHNGHSHLWNRFRSKNGVNYLETSNTGNTYGAYHGLSGRTRPVPPAPWDASNYRAIGNPGGLKPVVPSVAPLRNPEGAPLPFVQSNDHVVFTVLDTGANEVVSYRHDLRTPDAEPVVFDRFRLGRSAVTLRSGTVRATYGRPVTIPVEVSGAEGGTVQLRRGTRVLASAAVRNGTAQVRLPRTALKPGTHRLVAHLPGTTRTASAEAPVTVRVVKAPATIRASVVRAHGQAGARRPALRVRVTAPGVRPTGRVVVRHQGRWLGAAPVRDGRATVRIARPARPGAFSVRVRYAGSTTVRAVATRVRVPVARVR